jgi:hypothetical protein
MRVRVDFHPCIRMQEGYTEERQRRGGSPHECAPHRGACRWRPPFSVVGSVMVGYL